MQWNWGLTGLHWAQNSQYTNDEIINSLILTFDIVYYSQNLDAYEKLNISIETVVGQMPAKPWVVLATWIGSTIQ